MVYLDKGPTASGLLQLADLLNIVLSSSRSSWTPSASDKKTSRLTQIPTHMYAIRCPSKCMSRRKTSSGIKLLLGHTACTDRCRAAHNSICMHAAYTIHEGELPGGDFTAAWLAVLHGCPFSASSQPSTPPASSNPRPIPTWLAWCLLTLRRKGA